MKYRTWADLLESLNQLDRSGYEGEAEIWITKEEIEAVRADVAGGPHWHHGSHGPCEVKHPVTPLPSSTGPEFGVGPAKIYVGPVSLGAVPKGSYSPEGYPPRPEENA